MCLELQRRTGLVSRWSGVIHVSNNPLYLGAKQWSCDIDIDQSLLTRPRRYSTGLHELLHSVSVGLNPAEYPRFTGYEEGVVEQCTRLLRDEIFAAVGLQGPFDVRNSYPNEIAALEALRNRTLRPDHDFYLALLATPLQIRDAIVLQWIQWAEPMTSASRIDYETAVTRRILRP